MQKTLAFALCAAVGAAASAHPFGEQWSQKPVPGPVGGVDAPVEVDEDFEAYSVGELMTSRGGWELWGDATIDPQDAPITDLFAASGTKSADFSTTYADIVQEFSGITSGTVTYSANIYMPTGSDAEYYMIALNNYDIPGGTTNWSIQVRFNSFLGIVEAQTSVGNFQTPLIYDEWVEWRAEIDLDADEVDYFYDGVEFASDISWVNGVSGGGVAEFAAADLFTNFANTGNDVYVDDVLVETDGGGGCYADCDLSGSLDFFDFLCFQNAFSAQEPYADCDSSGSFDFFDFLCFQNQFAMGCP